AAGFVGVLPEFVSRVQLMRQYRAGDGAIFDLRLGPAGDSLVCVEGEKETADHRAIHWLDRRTGNRTRTLDLCESAWRKSIEYADEVAQTGRAFVSPDGLWVAVERYLGDPIFLDLWNGRTGKWRAEFFVGEDDDGDGLFCVHAAAFSPDSELIVYAAGTDGGGT